MPIPLPPVLRILPVVVVDVALVSGGRVTSYRFDLLDRDENGLGTLSGVQRGGDVHFDAYASVKGAGSITVTDMGQNVDWLNVRIRPVVVIEAIDGTETEVPAGVYLCAAPTEDWSASGRSWKVELIDKLSILDQDIVTSQTTAEGAFPTTFTAPVGANVIDLVKTIITETGEAAPAIEPGTKTLNNPITWDTGTTRLRVINDLLDAINYFSLYVDGAGQYRTEPYVAPRQRVPVYEVDTPFSKGDFSLMAPDWIRDRDIYAVPNRFVVVSAGSGEEEALVAMAVDDDQDSPFSYQSRGRWITQVETGVEAASIDDLEGIAERRLSSARSVTEMIEIRHLFLPNLVVNSMVRFVNPDAGLDLLCAVIQTSIPFDPTALCSSSLREMW